MKETKHILEESKVRNAIASFSNFGYVAACVVLYLIALCILISSVWGIIEDFVSGSFTVYKLLDEVGLIVFSMAVIDVGKYLMLEEVLRKESDQKAPADSRRTLTKFAIIITSALSLEGLVLTIEVAKRDVNRYFVSCQCFAFINHLYDWCWHLSKTQCKLGKSLAREKFLKVGSMRLLQEALAKI